MSRDVLFVRDVPAPPRERVPLLELRAEADRAKSRYAVHLEASFGCTARAHAQGRKCPSCAEVGILRFEWLTAERQWVEARHEAKVIDEFPCVELDMAQLAILVRTQSCAAIAA